MTETPSPLFKRRQTAIEAQTSPAIRANSQGNNIFFVKTRLVIFDYLIQDTICENIHVLKFILISFPNIHIGYSFTAAVSVLCKVHLIINDGFYEFVFNSHIYDGLSNHHAEIELF